MPKFYILIMLFTVLCNSDISQASRPRLPIDTKASPTKRAFLSLLKKIDKNRDDQIRERNPLDAYARYCIRNRIDDKSIHQALISQVAHWCKARRDLMDKKQKALKDVLDLKLLTDSEANFHQKIIEINYLEVSLWERNLGYLPKLLIPESKISLWLRKKLHPQLYKSK